MANVGTGDMMGTAIWEEPTTVAADTMPMDTAVATTMVATITATSRLTTTVRDSTAGPTILGLRQSRTDGARGERRGSDTTVTTSIPTPCMPARHCG